MRSFAVLIVASGGEMSSRGKVKWIIEAIDQRLSQRFRPAGINGLESSTGDETSLPARAVTKADDFGYLFISVTGTNLKEEIREMQTQRNTNNQTGRMIRLMLTLVGFIFMLSAAAQAATFHVINTNDSGPGSLRDAITQSNLIDPSTANLIDFQIVPAGGVKTISLQSGLPEITTPVVIDGTTQSGYAGNPIIELDGSNAGNSANGLYITAGNSTVKGLVINRFSYSGIRLETNGNNVIAGNYIGLDSAGTTSLPIGGACVYVPTSGNTIGGTTPAERNVLSGVTNRGIYFDGSNATGNLVKGNYIGTDATGNAGIGNSSGITFYNASGNTVGGTTAAERNIISGNSTGIDMTGSGASNNVVMGNYIGTKTDGTGNLANGFYGIYIYGGAHSNIIGGTHSGEGNVIAFQSREVALESDAGNGNTIRGNSMFSSGQMGIDLGNDAVTANDSGDADPGTNDLQNYPVITSVVNNNGNVDITGTLNSIASQQYVIDFYSSSTLSQQGNAEAKKYLATIFATTDGNGNANFVASVPVASLSGYFITATATDSNNGMPNSTSELSLPAQVAGLNGVLQFSAPTFSVNENGAQATITVTRSGGSFGFVSVHYATSDGTAKQPGDYTSASGTLSWADGDVSSKTFNVTITDDNIFEQSEAINLTLSSPVGGATLGAQSTAALTILDNEQPPNLADLVVTNTNDSGSGSLRQAITTANFIAGTDTISFNIQPAGVHTITPLSVLPNVTDPVIIDATTQPGFAGTPVIELNGASAGQSFVSGLTITGGSSTVKGFVINRYSGVGILLLSANNIVAGNFLGIDVTGNAAKVGNVSLSNYEGVGINGDNSNNNLIGGTTASARNVISNSQIGVDICCQGIKSGNKVVGNYIGTNAGGTAALRNSNYGIRIDDAPSTIIGGITPAERNVISGNFTGIQLSNSSTGTLIQGNYLGTKADGVGALGNDYAAIYSSYGITNATIGGTANGASNVIAFNGMGNTGNGGITLVKNVPVGATPSAGIVVSQNSIFSNKGLGIDLGADGVTTNDAGDGDPGSNDSQNYPVLTSVMTNGSNTVVQGTLNSEASKSYHIELFSNITCSSSGFGQGQFFVAATDVATDASGNAGFTFTIPTASITGTVFTATATNPNKSTSEFSACATSAAGSPGVIQFGASSAFVNESGGNAVVTVTRTGGSTGTVTVAYTTANGGGSNGAISPADYTATNGTLTFLDGETSKMISIPIPDDSISETDKYFSVNLSNPTGGATLGNQSSIQIGIGDNDAPTISINDVQVTEGNSGTTDAVFTVSLNRAYFSDAHVDFATVAGTATSGVDYQPTSGTLAFLKGETTKTVTVKINGDTTQEPNEAFTVKLSNNDSLSVSKGVGTGTINDDDAAQPAGTLAFSAATYTVNENGGQATITVKRTNGSGGAVSIQYATGAGGTATANADYTPANGTLNWADGDTADKAFTVAIVDDSSNEADETVNLVLSNATGGAVVGAPSTAALTISDNDVAQPPTTVQLEQAIYTVSEGAHYKQITITRTGDSSSAASVDYATSDGSASQHSDYTIALGTLQFASGEISKTLTLLITDDAYVEGDETVSLTLSNPVGVTLGAQSVAQVTITDNDNNAAAPNAIDDVPNFVRQNYHDFLNREPDAFGYQGWQDILNNCAAGDTKCDRIEVSSGFYRSPEFQERGYFTYRFYSASFGRKPKYAEFMPDMAKVSGFLTDAEKEAHKVAFINEFMSRQEFRNKYDSTINNPAGYVDGLLQAAGLQNHPSRAGWIAGLTNQTLTRAQVLRELVESSEVYQKYYTESFVVMQYFGYLRRDPDSLYLEWIKIMNQNGGDYRGMVNGFMNSLEYRQRFGN